MTIEALKSIPKWAGIYYFRNDTNSKYYIGQAVMIRKRLLHHISNYNTGRYDTPLYRAFKKYGLENFSVGILEEYKSGYSREELKNILDSKEKFYIEKFNSYGNTGYNQTIGGDAGVLGYKLTEDQLRHLSKNSKDVSNDGRNIVYCFDVVDKSTYTAVSLAALNTILKVHFTTSQIRYNLSFNRYVLARTQDKLEEKIKYLNNHRKSLINSELYDDITSLSYKDFMNKYKVCKKTYYNYKKRISLWKKKESLI